MKREKMNYAAVWEKAVNDQELSAKALTQRDWEEKAALLALGPYKLMCFTERLACQYETPWLNLVELQPLHLYLLNKHHWPLDQVQGVNFDQALLLLHEELALMRLTEQEWGPVDQWAIGKDCYQELKSNGPST